MAAARALLVWLWYHLSRRHFCTHCDAATFRQHNHHEAQTALLRRHGVIDGSNELVGSAGAELIEAERRRQKTIEGYSFRHDVSVHREGRPLEAAAFCYWWLGHLSDPPEDWPWAARFWKPKDPVRNLTRAGALFLAQIDVDQWTVTCDYMEDGRSYSKADVAKRHLERMRNDLRQVTAELNRLV